jgi:hypothetical protein
VNTRKPVLMQQGHSNDFQTPPEALEPLWQYLRPGWTVWECACGDGILVRALAERHFQVIGSDLRDGRNFLTWRPDEPWDCLLTNPPYTAKQSFLERAYALGRPFALLLPLTALETRRRQRLFARHGLEVIFLPHRIRFLTPSGKPSRPWFGVAWFTHGLGVGRQMTFFPELEPRGGGAARPVS